MNLIETILKATFSSLIILSGCFCSLFGQSYFNKLVDFDTSYANFSMDAVQLGDFYYVSGQSYYSTNEPLTLIKLSLSGDVVWKKEYPEKPKQFQGEDIEVINDSTLIIFGEVIPTSGGYTSLYYWIIDTSGTIIKDSMVGDSNLNNLIYNAENINSDFLLVATSRLPSTKKSIHIIKLDNSGAILWSKKYSFGDDDWGGGIASTIDGGYLVSAATVKNGNSQWLLMKIDNLGDKQWVKEYGDIVDDDYIPLIVFSKDSNYLLSDTYEKNNNGKPLARLYKLNNNGEIIWEVEYQVGNNYTSIVRNVIENDDRTITAIAWTENSSGRKEATIMKFSPLGNLLWYRDYTNDSTKHQYAWGITNTLDDGYIIVGSVTDSTQDAWIQKVDCEGCDSIQCAMQDSCMVYDCHTDSLPSAAFENQDTIRLGDTLKITNTSKFSSGYWWDIDLAQHQSWVNPEYEFLDTGIYTVRLVAYNVDCRDTLEKQIVVIDSTTGMMENQSVNKNIKIYPNPTKGILSIEIKNKLKPLNVKITDVFGRELHSQSLSTSKSTLNLQDLSKGVYFVIITDNNKIAYKEKLVLMK